MFDDADSFPVNRKDTYLGPNPSYWKKCSSMRNDLSEPEMDIEEIEVVTKSLIQNDSLIPNQVSAVLFFCNGSPVFLLLLLSFSLPVESFGG